MPPMNTRRLRLVPLALLLAGVLSPPVWAGRPTGRLIELIDSVMPPTDSAGRQDGNAGAATRELVSVWNPQGCGFTDSANLHLSEPTRLDRLDIWYNWARSEGDTAYEITASNGQAVSRGTLMRDSCDPYQASWCVGTTAPRITLPAGDYVVRTPAARICQNPASRGEGFIKAWGAVAMSGSGLYRGDGGSRNAPDGGAAVAMLGTRWHVREEIPGGRYWTGEWRRRRGTNIFDAVWRDSLSGQSLSDVIEIRSVDDGTVRLYRHGNGGYYTGHLSPDRRNISGSASWYPPGAFWTARIGE